MKRLLMRALAVASALTVGAQLYAGITIVSNCDAPANDNLANAQKLSGDFGAVIADTTGSTRESDETGLNYYGQSNTVWYVWTSTSQEKMPLTVSSRTLGGNDGMSVRVDVFTGTSYGNMSYCASGINYAEFCAEPGKTYLIRLTTYTYLYDGKSFGKAALFWSRRLAEGEWNILAADGIVLRAYGDLPKDFKVSDFPQGVTRIAGGAFAYRMDGDTAFQYSRKMKFVTIPSTVTEIDDCAFEDSDLEWVDYEGDVSAVKISNTAFLGTPYSLELPFKFILNSEVVTNIYQNAKGVLVTNIFEASRAIEGFVGTCPADLAIPEGIEGIFSGAFNGLGNETLAKVTFPSTLKFIDEWAFGYCEALAEVTGIPADANVHDNAFADSLYEKVRPFELVTCTRVEPVLDSFVADDGSGFYTEHYYYDDYYDNDDYYDGYYTVWTTNTWVVGFHGTCPEEVVIPEGIYGIAEGAFSVSGNDYYYYDEWYWYDGNDYFDDQNYYEFWRGDNMRSAANLKKVTLPKTVKEIGRQAFGYLPNLEEVVFDGEKELLKEFIDNGVFTATPYFMNQPIELIYWTDEFSNRWVDGYRGYKAPETLVIPDGVYGIFSYAFEDLDGLVAVTIPASVKEIGRNAFAYCEDLATVTFLGNRDEINKDYDNRLDYVFVGTPYSATLPFKLLASNLGDRDGFDKPVFDVYGEFVESVWVAFDEPKPFWRIDGYIGTCPERLDLTQFLPNNLGGVEFEDEAFENADTLKELVLPNAAYLENAGTFRYCANLATVSGGGVYAADKRWLTYNFQGTPWLENAVPFELIMKPETTTNITPVEKKDTNCCTPYTDKYAFVTNITTTKVVVGYYGNVPATLTFPEDVGKIASYVFEDCDNITEVIVPGNVKEVGDGVFVDCDNLQNVEFQEGVEEIGVAQFYGCGDGMQVILPASAVVGHYVADEDGTDDDDFMWRGVDCKWIEGWCNDSYVFYGIVGDVDVVAPRVSWIYDRAFMSGSYFGRTCVEYYTHVVLDANGGAIDGEADYRCYDDVVTGLPTPVLAGNVFREWWDDDDSYYRNGDAWDEYAPQVYLKAEWATERVFYVYGLKGPTEIRLGIGDDYETLLRVLEDNFGAEPEPSRHGLRFRYWTVDGNELNHRSVIGDNSVFGAYFDEFNPLSDNPEAKVDDTAAQTYDGYILDYKGNNAGTIQVKVGKPNKNTGEANVSAKVQMFGGAKLSFKADPKGKWKIATDGATKGVTLSTAKAADKIVIDISEKGVFGTFGAYDIIASRNTSKKDAAYANWSGKSYDIAFKTKEGTGSAFTGGYSGVNVSIANKGKVKITGVMADGTKVNASAQLLISDKGEGCVNVFVPMYSGKAGGFGFVLWIDPDFTKTYVESVSTWICTDKKAPFTAELEFPKPESEFMAAAAPAPAAAMAFVLETTPAISGATVLTEYLPLEAKPVKVTFNGSKITVAKANRVKFDNKTKTVVRTGTTDNDAELKLNYSVKSGSFKGSFSVYTIANSKLKKIKANVNGVFVNGVGYGTAVIRGVGSFPVVLQ